MTKPGAGLLLTPPQEAAGFFIAKKVFHINTVVMITDFTDQGRRYRGPVWIGPTDRSHCERCDGGNKPIPTGIGIHFQDAQTGHYVVTGRSCFEKLAGVDVKLSSLPVIGMSFAEAQFRTNTRPLLGKGHTATEFDRSVHGPEWQKRNEAIENVWIRVDLEEKFGVRLGQLKYFKPFQTKILDGSLSDTDMALIKKTVDIGVNRFQKLNLEQIRNLYVVAYQLSALERKRLYSSERKYVREVCSDIRRYHGLTDRQMEYLEQVADRNGITLSSKHIRFPENEARAQSRRTSFTDPSYKKT